RGRRAAGADVVERRALEEVLGRVGGKDAFSALLAALDTPDVEAARAAALAVRERVKEATPREKAGYLAQVSKLVRTKGKASKKKGANPALVAGGLKILGYLEDPAAAPTLLGFARDKRQPVAVREEAIVALRFTARGKAGARGAATLLDLAGEAARAVRGAAAGPGGEAPRRAGAPGPVHDGQPRAAERALPAAEEDRAGRRGRTRAAGDRAAGADRDAGRGRRPGGGAGGDAGSH